MLLLLLLGIDIIITFIQILLILHEMMCLRSLPISMLDFVAGNVFKASKILLGTTPELYTKYVMLFDLFKAEWSFGVKKQVLRMKSQKSIKKRLNLPTKEDLDKVKTFMQKQFHKLMKKEINMYTEYRYLVM